MDIEGIQPAPERHAMRRAHPEMAGVVRETRRESRRETGPVCSSKATEHSLLLGGNSGCEQMTTSLLNNVQMKRARDRGRHIKNRTSLPLAADQAWFREARSEIREIAEKGQRGSSHRPRQVPSMTLRAIS